jgi:hypothetical protein
MQKAKHAFRRNACEDDDYPDHYRFEEDKSENEDHPEDHPENFNDKITSF